MAISGLVQWEYKIDKLIRTLTGHVLCIALAAVLLKV